MNRFAVILLLSVCFSTTLQGCSYRAWYTGFQEEQRRKCYDNPISSEIRNCLERANMSYDDYNKYREDSKKQTRSAVSG